MSLDADERENMLKICALIVILLEYAKIIVLGLSRVEMARFVPLHLCSMAGLAVMVYALWPHMNWLGQLFAFAFVPAALTAVLFPSITMYPWLNFYNLHTFIFHGLIIAFFTWLLMSGEIAPNYAGLWLSFLFVMTFSVPIYFLNNAFHTNYMYIVNRTDVPVLSTLWDKIVLKKGKPVFMALILAIMLIVMHFCYGIYALIC